MNSEKIIRVTKLRENFISMQICCNLAPNEMKLREKEVFKQLPDPCTMNGWTVKWDVEPLRCAEEKGYWHYVCVL